DVEARAHRAAGAEQGAGLARAAHAVLEELRVVDRDRRLLAEALEHALMVRRERRGPRRKRRDHAEEALAPRHRHAEHGADTLALVDVTSRRPRVAADVVDEDRLPCVSASADDPLTHRQLERAPLVALETVRRRLHEGLAVAADERDTAARGPDERRDRAADAVEHGGKSEPRGDEAARGIER